MPAKTDTTHIENVTTPPKPSKRQKFARHCKRYWWAHLMIFICSSVLQITLIIFVAVPKIAQSKMNGVKLSTDRMEITDPRADSYHLRSDSTIQTDGKIKATVSAFDGVMYLDNVQPHAPFATVSFPQTNSDKLQTVNISQRVRITDMKAFTQFNIWFQANETIRLTIEGKTEVQPKGLNRKYGVTFKKTVDIKGLNGLKEVRLVKSQFRLDQDKSRPNLEGVTEILNPSNFVMELGNVTYTNYVEEKDVGRLELTNLILYPGKNLIDFTARLDSAIIFDTVNKEPYCKTGIIPLKLQATLVKNDGEELKYFSAAMGATNQTVDADVGTMVEKETGVNIECSN